MKNVKSTTEIDLQIGIRIALLRRRCKWSQTKLGNAIGVTFQQVQKYENGKNRIGASRLQKIAQALGVNIGDLFGNDPVDQVRVSDANLTIDGANELISVYSEIDDPELRQKVLAFARAAALVGNARV